MAQQFIGVIVGMKYRDVARPADGTPVVFKPEPENQVDPEAVAAYCNNQKVGYIPKHNSFLKSKANSGNVIIGRIIKGGKSTLRVKMFILNKKESRKYRETGRLR